MFKHQEREHVINVQRLEGAALLILATYNFSEFNVSWWWFFGLLLTVDATMAGYLINNKVGAYTYNIGHSLVLPLLLTLASKIFGWNTVEMLCTIWLAHIGMDRLSKFGLKHVTSFHHTHLGTIGRKK